MAGKFAKTGLWEVSQAENGTITVKRTYKVTAQGLRELSSEVGFTPGENWNVRHFGSKLIDFINEEAAKSEKGLEGTLSVWTGKSRLGAPVNNRLALGIINAYLLKHPKTSLEELRQFCPNSIVLGSGVDDVFVTPEIGHSFVKWHAYFTSEDEILRLADGTEVACVCVWTLDDFTRLLAHANKHDIYVLPIEEELEEVLFVGTGFKIGRTKIRENSL